MSATILIDSPVGELTLASDGEAVTGLHFGRAGNPAGPADGILEAARAELAEFFAGERRSFGVPARPRGTPFQEAVWAALLAIPYGETEGYGALAERVGRPGAARAVGLANGRNPVAIMVPCHRVVGASGSLTGYGGGLERKRWLLALEAATARW